MQKQLDSLGLTIPIKNYSECYVFNIWSTTHYIGYIGAYIVFT